MHKVPLLCGTSFKASLSPWVNFSLAVMIHMYIYMHPHTSVSVTEICIYRTHLLYCKTLLQIGKIKRTNFSTQYLREVGITEFRCINSPHTFFFCTWIHHSPQQYLMSAAVHACSCKIFWYPSVTGNHHWITVFFLHV